MADGTGPQWWQERKGVALDFDAAVQRSYERQNFRVLARNEMTEVQGEMGRLTERTRDWSREDCARYDQLLAELHGLNEQIRASLEGTG